MSEPKFEVGDIVYAYSHYPNEKLIVTEVYDVTTVYDLTTIGYKNLVDECKRYDYVVRRPNGMRDMFSENLLSNEESEKIEEQDEIRVLLENFFEYEISYIFDYDDMQVNITSLEEVISAFNKIARELGVNHIEDIVDKLTEIYNEE